MKHVAAGCLETFYLYKLCTLYLRNLKMIIISIPPLKMFVQAMLSHMLLSMITLICEAAFVRP